MDIRLLRYFLAAAHEETITGAAERLHISQPTLSKQLMELEQELGKPLLVRGKRKITLTEDGILLRRRAEEIVALMDKTERELTASHQLTGEAAIGGTPTDTILRAAAAIRARHPGIRFQFYSSDAIDVQERLDHGSLDFAMFLEPIDAVKYDYISLPESSRWGLLMPEDCALAQKRCVTREDFRSVPLVFPRRPGLQRILCRWAQADMEQLNIAATYNVTNGAPSRFVTSGIGLFLTTQELLPARLEEGLCFRLLEPELEIHYALIWKRYAAFSKAGEAFLDEVRRTLSSAPLPDTL